MIKHAAIFKFTEAMPDQDELIEALSTLHPAGEPQALELSRSGWSPLWRNGEQAYKVTPQIIAISMLTHERLLPAAVVRKALAEKVEQIEADEGRPVGRKEKTRLKDEIIIDLTPKAFITAKRTDAYIDYQRQLLVVDSSSQKRAEDLASLLRETLGSLKCRPLVGDLGYDLASRMRRWIQGDETSPFQVDDEATFVQPVERGATVKVKGLELAGNHELEELVANDTVEKLRLTLADQISFTLTMDARLNRIVGTDALYEQAAEVNCDDAMARFTADLILMADAIGKVLEKVIGKEE